MVRRATKPNKREENRETRDQTQKHSVSHAHCHPATLFTSNLQAEWLSWRLKIGCLYLFIPLFESFSKFKVAPAVAARIFISLSLSGICLVVKPGAVVSEAPADTGSTRLNMAIECCQVTNSQLDTPLRCHVSRSSSCCAGLSWAPAAPKKPQRGTVRTVTANTTAMGLKESSTSSRVSQFPNGQKDSKGLPVRKPNSKATAEAKRSSVT